MTDGGIAADDGGTAAVGDGGVFADGGARVDGGGTPPDMTGGCACNAQGGSGRGGWLVLGVVVGLAAMRRRR